MYNKRIWLNKISSPSTGSIVCFDGEMLYRGEMVNNSFVQISDCDRSIRLHKIEGETDNDFIEKLEVLKNEVEHFINHLNGETENNNL